MTASLRSSLLNVPNGFTELVPHRIIVALAILQKAMETAGTAGSIRAKMGDMLIANRAIPRKIAIRDFTIGS